MGRKSKKKNLSNGHAPSPANKRKLTHADDPPAKRQKEEEKWFPGKFVLLKPQTSDDEIIETPESPKENEAPASTSQDKKSKKSKVNGDTNGKSSRVEEKPKKKKTKIEPTIKKSDLEKIYADNASGSDNDEWMDMSGDELDFESVSDDEELGEEWSTDTDYSEGDSMSFGDSSDDSLDDSLDEEEYSFHGSDCESVETDDDEDEGGRNYKYMRSDGNSSDDSDYVPDLEDKYIKFGHAVLYDAKGLDLAFGDSFESQIIEIKDIHPAIMDKNVDEEVPDLVTLTGDVSMEDDNKVPPEAVWKQTTLSQDAESLIKDLQIDDDEEGLKCDELLKCATFYDCIDDQGVVLKLSNTIHFHGILIIRAIANRVQVNGYTLQPTEVITATSISRADYFLNLTPVVDANYSKEILQENLKNLLTFVDATKIIKTFDPKKEVLVHVQQGLPDPTVEMLKNYSQHALLPSKKMILTNSPCQSSELILSAKFFVGSENLRINSFELNEQWHHLEVQSSSRLVIIGGKNVGKSGLCQFIINKNIESFKKILLIDLDIGQPICTPAQTISATLITKPIIGPGYLSKNQPDKSLLYGDKSVMIAPFKYVRCVRQLVEFCAKNPDYKDIPWVVNTMGYQKGFGLQLVCLLTKILQPTDVVQIQHGVQSYNFAKILTEELANDFEFTFFDSDDVAGVPARNVFTTHVLDSIVNNRGSDSGVKWISNSTDKRKLSMLAQVAKLLKSNQQSLNDVTPFVAPIDKIRMLVIDEEYSQREQGFNMDLLNGNLVFLCRADNEMFLDSNSILECHGVGIVRAIDKNNGKIFLLLPQTDSGDKLQVSVNVLALGNIPLPSEILLKQNYSIAGNVPHVTFFKDRNASSKKYVNKRHIKDCY